MAICKRTFASADEYEQWLAEVGDRVRVLTIDNAPALMGASTLVARAPVIVRFETRDKSLAPAKTSSRLAVEIGVIAIVFFALFAYVVFER